MAFHQSWGDGRSLTARERKTDWHQAAHRRRFGSESTTTTNQASTMNISFIPKKSCVKIMSALAPTVALLLGLATSARADWPNTNATKWVQFPDPTPNGLDVLAAQPAAGTLPIILADDFLCKRAGPITDIHIWGSWLNDTNDCNLPITLSIWTDVPAITNQAPSHPGTRVWTQTFAPGQYSARPWKTANELFWNPDPSPFGTILGQDHLIWQYNFYPTDPFVQQGLSTAPVVYWLSMTAGANIQRFGWKTSTNHWGDDAVFGHLDAAGGNPVGDWQELRDPKTTGNRRSLDLAFALTTPQIITNPPPATNKWVQYPDPNGLDVDATRPNILADDFLCKAAGTITNIQVWASWKDNVTADPTMTFELGIWSDVPGGNAGGANTFSHPGALLWRETFGPGNYGFALQGSGNEQFYDPNTGQLSAENSIWRYNFNPKKPYCQRGSTTTPVVYWLSVRAFTTNTANNFRFGWKTSTNHWNDDAVFGHVTSTGTAIGDWQELHDPRTSAALVSLDLAFLLNNGPPSADCDPHLGPKFVQWPDPSTNGLDVRATWPKMLADDFLCRAAGPISGVTVWGSWLGDNVDTNAQFQLSLWTDVPAIPGTTNYSRPGQLLCTTAFYPPQSVATSLLRYKYRLDTPNVRETFYDPDLPGLSGFIGNDSQIWRYDFYPPACWRQNGSPFGKNKVFWLGVTALTDTNKYLFGWKTSTNHWNDDGVFGHLDAANNPPKDWKDLHDPRPPTNSLDLSFALRTFPIVGINKDLRNVIQPAQPAAGIRIVVAGLHEITWHYDDSPPWPIFTVSYSGGDTVLEWTGKTVAPGAISHVGFQMGGTSISIGPMAWLNATGGVIGRPIQVNQHTWNNGLTLTLNNDIAGTPVMVQPPGALPAMVEFFDDPTPLDAMVPGGNRNPIGVATLPVQPAQIGPGCSLRIPVPTAPPGARYALFIINLGDQQGQPATMDFLQLPLDAGLQPTIHSATPMGDNIRLRFSTIPDRTYRVQSAPTLMDSFFDVFLEINGDGEMMDVDLPIMGEQGYYRIMLDPE
jgi:hypothetical protein